MNRGSLRWRAAAERRPRRFNEAPIHESGKWQPNLHSADAYAPRFNEAPIHESGKFAPSTILSMGQWKLQ